MCAAVQNDSGGASWATWEGAPTAGSPAAAAQRRGRGVCNRNNDALAAAATTFHVGHK
jgi:hypothetical protein